MDFPLPNTSCHPLTLFTCRSLTKVDQATQSFSKGERHLWYIIDRPVAYSERNNYVLGQRCGQGKMIVWLCVLSVKLGADFISTRISPHFSEQ